MSDQKILKKDWKFFEKKSAFKKKYFRLFK